jgi:hypothetical protein
MISVENIPLARFAGLSLTDLLLTHYGVGNSITREINPFADWLMTYSFLPAYILKFSAVALIIFIVVRTRNKFKKVNTIGVPVINLIMYIIVAFNLINLIA